MTAEICECPLTREDPAASTGVEVVVAETVEAMVVVEMAIEAEIATTDAARGPVQVDATIAEIDEGVAAHQMIVDVPEIRDQKVVLNFGSAFDEISYPE